MVVFQIIFRIRYYDLNELEDEFIDQFKNCLLERLDIEYFNFSIEFFNNKKIIEYHLFTYDNFDVNNLGLLLEDLREYFSFLEIITSINIF